MHNMEDKIDEEVISRFIGDLSGQVDRFRDSRSKSDGGLGEIARKFQEAEERIHHLTTLVDERDLEIHDLKEKNRETRLMKEALEQQLEELTIHFNEQKDDLIQAAKTREEELKAAKGRLQDDLDGQIVQLNLQVAESKEREKSLKSELGESVKRGQALSLELEAKIKGMLKRIRG